MLSLLGCLVLFFVLLGLVWGFHLFLWSRGRSLSGDRVWASSFECGFVSSRLAENYFSFTYFLLLVFFVVFDLEVSLLLNLPYCVGIKNVSSYVLFLVFLCFGYTAEVAKGYVVWSY
uniref:NADH-ubiquinone oxidoreductase chain 3 n=1 Tax=Tanaisia sp. SS-2020 TaxID=2780549 RepID=A0A894JLF2_9TREM|nr:NADH dehydrogenase subunit 3 [Tanaisia sp. SS-2020]